MVASEHDIRASAYGTASGLEAGTKYVPGFLAQSVLAACQQRGRVPVRLALLQSRIAGLEAGSLSATWRELDELLHAASVNAGDATLALWVGQQISEANLNLVGQVIVASRSLRGAIEHMDAVQTHIARKAPWRLSEREADARYTREPANLGTASELLMVALEFGLLRRYFASVGITDAVRDSRLFALFTCKPPADLDPYREVFGEQIRFGCDEAGCSFARELLDVNRSGTDPALAALLTQLALERFPQADTGTWFSRLENALRELNTLAQVDIARIARRWNITPRTLRRHLKVEGQSVTEVLNRVRFERARSILRLDEMALQEVALQLGYSDVSSFQRAFKRWSGSSAHAFRMGLRDDGCVDI